MMMIIIIIIIIIIINTFSHENVHFRFHMDKTCVRDVFFESPLNTDIRLIQRPWHVPFSLRVGRVPLYLAIFFTWVDTKFRVLNKERL